MLDPDQRALYADALRPPAGHVFGEAVATTYTLGLDTLLTVPLQLALFDRRDAGEGLGDGVAILEALRRTSDRLTVFYQEGRIHVPAAKHLLFSLVEPIVHAVRAPGGGAFHAKLWAIRFEAANGTGRDAIRVLVLSRNLTFDRSWDLSLRLDGTVGDPAGALDAAEGDDPVAAVLSDFVRGLPALAPAGVPEAHAARAARVADALARARLERPPGFREARAFVHGLGGLGWQPGPFDELAIVSPFVDAPAVEALVAATKKPLALISRADELDRLPTQAREYFERVLVLDESAETEDGEDTADTAASESLRGLHAKAYFGRRGSDVHVVMGSANATRPGLLEGGNVELLVELVGRRKKVGEVGDFFDGNGFGELLDDHRPPEGEVESDAAERAADARLDAARAALARAGLVVECEAAPDEGGASSTDDEDNLAWSLALVMPGTLVLEGITRVRAWPVTIADEQATTLDLDGRAGRRRLGRVALVSITGLIAFELETSVDGAEADATRQTRFVLNLPLSGLPEGRDAALLKTVLKNNEGFLRYLALLLAEIDEDPLASGSKAGAEWAAWLRKAGAEELALLEPLVRALARDPAKLEDVRRVVHRLCSDERAAEDVVPTEFLELWESFEQALDQPGALAGSARPKDAP